MVAASYRPLIAVAIRTTCRQHGRFNGFLHTNANIIPFFRQNCKKGTEKDFSIFRFFDFRLRNFNHTEAQRENFSIFRLLKKKNSGHSASQRLCVRQKAGNRKQRTGRSVSMKPSLDCEVQASFLRSPASSTWKSRPLSFVAQPSRLRSPGF